MSSVRRNGFHGKGAGVCRLTNPTTLQCCVLALLPCLGLDAVAGLRLQRATSPLGSAAALCASPAAGHRQLVVAGASSSSSSASAGRKRAKGAGATSTSAGRGAPLNDTAAAAPPGKKRRRMPLSSDPTEPMRDPVPAAVGGGAAAAASAYGARDSTLASVSTFLEVVPPTPSSLSRQPPRPLPSLPARWQPCKPGRAGTNIAFSVVLYFFNHS